MKLDTLHDLYIHELQDLHSVETQIKAALPAVIKAATEPKLKTALKDHLEETKEQIVRLNTILKGHSEKQEVEKCLGMEGILKECADMIAHEASTTIRDLAIISACQSVEHYEIAGYGTARAYAETLSHEDDVSLLAETLDEESAADEKLTDIASALQAQCQEESDEAATKEAPVKTKKQANCVSGSAPAQQRAGSR